MCPDVTYFDAQNLLGTKVGMEMANMKKGGKDEKSSLVMEDEDRDP